MEDNTIKVKIADLAVKKNEGVIVTVGLGSCVGIALYDSVNKVGGLAHILLADSKLQNKNESFNKAKFADTAIPLLIGKMESLGAERKNLRAKIAGGSQLFNFQKKGISIGEKILLQSSVS